MEEEQKQRVMESAERISEAIRTEGLGQDVPESMMVSGWVILVTWVDMKTGQQAVSQLRHPRLLPGQPEGLLWRGLNEEWDHGHDE